MHTHMYTGVFLLNLASVNSTPGYDSNLEDDDDDGSDKGIIPFILLECCVLHLANDWCPIVLAEEES